MRKSLVSSLHGGANAALISGRSRERSIARPTRSSTQRHPERPRCGSHRCDCSRILGERRRLRPVSIAQHPASKRRPRRPSIRPSRTVIEIAALPRNDRRRPPRRAGVSGHDRRSAAGCGKFVRYPSSPSRASTPASCDGTISQRMELLRSLPPQFGADRRYEDHERESHIPKN